MSRIIPKTRRGMFGFIAVIIYLILSNWPVMKWAYSLQTPPNIVYILGFPFAIFWAVMLDALMLILWVYIMLTVGEAMSKNVEISQTFKQALQNQK